MTPSKLSPTVLEPVETAPQGTGRDSITGRFLKGNRTSRKHGLRAFSAAELRPRHNRAGWLLKGLLNDLDADGRQLKPWEKLRARRWCEMEVVADDGMRALLDQGFPDTANSKLWEIYVAAVREQGAISRELGMTRATEERLREGEPDQVALWAAKVRRTGQGA